MNIQVKVTWRILRTISHSLIEHARVLEAYIHFFINVYRRSYFSGSINQISDKQIQRDDHSIQTWNRYKTFSITFRRVIFPGVVRKATAHVDKSGKYASQNSIFVGIPQHQKGYLVYVPSTRKIIFSYDVVFYESFSSLLEYTSQHYSEVMDMRPAVTYTPYATYLKEQTDDIIMFIHFE